MNKVVTGSTIAMSKTMDLDNAMRSSSVSAVTGGGRIFQSQPSLCRAQLTLTAGKLECRDSEQAEGETEPRLIGTFLLEDLVGVHVSELPSSHNKTACQMDVHMYPVVKKKSRKMTVLSVCFDAKDTFDDNMATAREWKKAIKQFSYQRLRQTFYGSEAMPGADSSVEAPQRHFLVLINPVGGQGKAEDDFEKHVQPLFDRAEITYEVVVTERQNHARDLMKDYDFSKIDGMAIASGDGLLYEVVNGIMQREDWEQAIKTPIGMLPTGSGNALCASALYEAGEEYGLVNAAFQIIQGGVIPMDITTVETASKQTLYMTLLGSWGMIADVDIESEKFRKIGETRFVIGALNCIRKKRIYEGRLAYLPYDNGKPTVTRSTSVPTQAPNGADSDDAMSPARSHSISVPSEHTPTSTATCIDTTVQTQGSGDVTATGVETEKGITNGETDEESQEKDITNGETDEECRENVAQMDGARDVQVSQSQSSPVTIKRQSSSTGPRADLLPDLSEAIPDNWKVIEGEFTAISPLMVPLLSAGFFGDPNMSIGTGKIRLACIRRMSRFGMLSLLTGADKGKHIERPEVETFDAKAFRLEPKTEKGLLTVDGEVIEYGPMQAQLHQHLARVFCSKKRLQDMQPT